MSATAKLEIRDLCSRYDSSRIFFLFCFSRFWRATATAATTAEEFLAKARPGIPTRPGIKYPVRETPHSDE